MPLLFTSTLTYERDTTDIKYIPSQTDSTEQRFSEDKTESMLINITILYQILIQNEWLKFKHSDFLSIIFSIDNAVSELCHFTCLFYTLQSMEPQRYLVHKKAKLCKTCVVTVIEPKLPFRLSYLDLRQQKIACKSNRKPHFLKLYCNDENKNIQDVYNFSIMVHAFLNCHCLALVKIC